MNFVFKKPLQELLLNDVLPQWKRVLADDEETYKLEIELRTNITAGAACASTERFKLIGRWSNIKRRVDIHNVGTKRVLDRCVNYYYSTKPVRA